MKVTLEFDLKELDCAQRFLLRELFGDTELPMARHMTAIERGEMERATVQAHEEISAALTESKPDPGKTEVVGVSQLEGFVPPRRGRKAGGKAAEDARFKDRNEPPPIAETAADLASSVGMDAPVIVSSAGPEIATPAVDPAAIGGDEELTAQPVVTDKDLHNACATKMVKGVSAGRQNISTEVRALIGEYVQAGQGVAMIPQSARAGFLEKLAAL